MIKKRFALIAAAAMVLASSGRAAQDDVVEARGILEKAVKEYPLNSELHVHLAFVYKKLGLTEDAQKEFEEAVRMKPSKAEAHYMLGLLYEKKGLRGKAKSAWKACAEHAKEESMKETAARHLHLLESTKDSDAKP